MADASIIARLILRARDFSTEFQKTLSDAERKSQSSGAIIARSLGDGIGDGMRDITARVPLIGGSLTNLSGAASVAAAGIAAFGLAAARGIGEAEEFAAAVRGLDAVLTATGNKTGLARQELIAYAEELEGKLAIPAEEILKAQQALSTFDGVAGETFTRAIEAASDLSATFGGDLASNSEKLGTTLQNLAAGNVEGLSRGFRFLGSETLDAVAALAEAGQTAKAQEAFLKALEDRIGGAGAASNQGLSGAWFRLNDAVGDFLRMGSEETGANSGLTRLINNTAREVEWLSDLVGNFDLGKLKEIVTGPSTPARPTPLLPTAPEGDFPQFRNGRFVAAPSGRQNAAEAAAEKAHQEAVVAALKDQNAELDGQRAKLERRLKLGEQQARVEEAVETALAKAKGATEAQRAAIERSVRANATLEQQIESQTKTQGKATQAAEAAARARKADADAQARRNVELDKAIDRIEQEVDLIGTTKQAHEDVLELMRLQEVAGRALTDVEKERVENARALVRIYEAARKGVEDLENFDPTAASRVGSDKAIDKPLYDEIERGLDDFDKRVKRIDEEHAERWEEAGRRGGQALRDEGLLAVEAIGQVLGGKLGRTVSKIAAIFNGVGTGDFTGLNSGLGGLLTIFSGGGKLGQQAPDEVPVSIDSRQLGQVFEPINAGFENIGKNLDGLFGTGPSLSDLRQSGYGSDAIPKGFFEGISKAVGTGMQGAAIGSISDDILDGLGVKSSNTGAQLGGAAGMFIGGPVGALIGGAIGGFLGGLLKKDQKATVTLGTDATGNADLGNTQASGKGSAARLAAAQESGNAFIEMLSTIADQFGVGLAANMNLGSLGTRNDKFVFDPSGQNLTKRKNGALHFDTEEEAIQYALTNAIEKGVIQGLRESTKRLLTAGGDFEAALQKALKFEAVFDELEAAQNPAAAAVKALGEQMTDLTRIFQEAGASAEEYAQLEQYRLLKIKQIREQAGVDDLDGQIKAIENPDAFAVDQLNKKFAEMRGVLEATGATTEELTKLDKLYALELQKLGETTATSLEQLRADILDGILAIQDPTGFELKELDEKFATLREELTALGGTAEDLAKLEELYGLERKRILEQTLGDMTSAFEDFRDSLNAGSSSPLSLRDQRANIEQQFAAFEAQINGGQSVDPEAFVKTAQTLLDIERQLSGSTAAFFTQFNRVQALNDKAIGLSGASNVVSIRPEATSTFNQQPVSSAPIAPSYSAQPVPMFDPSVGANTAATARSTAETVTELRQGFAMMERKLDRLSPSGSAFIGDDRRGFVARTVSR